MLTQTVGIDSVTGVEKLKWIAHQKAILVDKMMFSIICRQSPTLLSFLFPRLYYILVCSVNFLNECFWFVILSCLKYFLHNTLIHQLLNSHRWRNEWMTVDKSTTSAFCSFYSSTFIHWSHYFFIIFCFFCAVLWVDTDLSFLSILYNTFDLLCILYEIFSAIWFGGKRAFFMVQKNPKENLNKTSIYNPSHFCVRAYDTKRAQSIVFNHEKSCIAKQ